MFPRWLTWLVLIILAYVVVQTGRSSQERLPSATLPETTAEQSAPPAEEAKTLPPALDQATDMERWKRAINPDYAARAQCDLAAKPGSKPALLWKVTEDKPGSGAGAKCTETITVKLTVWNPQGTASYEGELPLSLGAREVAAGLDVALVGIKKGGIRTVILSPTALQRDKKAPIPKPALAALGNGRMTIVTVERLQ